MKSAVTILKKIGIGLAVAIFWLTVWILIARIVDKELLLPYPQSVLQRLCELCLTLAFWETVLLSIGRILLGTVLAIIAGTGLAILTCKIPVVHRFFYPMITVIRATPVASFVILAIIWMGPKKLPALICFLMALPIIWAAVCDGIRALDPHLKQVCRAYSLPFSKRLFSFYIPAILPYFLSACKTSLGLAWKAGVAAEVIARTPVSIGIKLSDSQIAFDTTALFAWTLVIILLNLLIEKISSWIINHASTRRNYAES